MNYYPQYGQNPYYQQNVYQQPNYYQQQPQITSQVQQSQYTLFGKVVDGVEVVRATDVPINQTGIFPKGDMSEIYLKIWMPDGTTKITTFVPVVENIPEKKEDDKYSVALSEIQSAISALSKKVDGIKPSSSTSRRKKEVDEDDDE